MGSSKSYSKELAECYDYRHFGGASGQFILQKDTRALMSLLPAAPATVLDIPCGTGVYTDILQNLGYDVVGADASWHMLQMADMLRPDAAKLQGDVTRLPLKEDVVDAVISLRLFSHFLPADIVRSLKELRRIVRPGGMIIFDSFRWTPRRWPLLRNYVAQGYIHEYSPEQTETLISAAGLRVADTQCSYLFSPIWQRKLPLPLLRIMTEFEVVLPDRWLLRTFWACTKE